MSRLDRHVAMVQNKLALGRFIHALAWASLAFAAAFWIALVVDKLFRVRPPHYMIWVYAGAGVGVLYAVIYAIVKRPTSHEAAVFIDQKLSLKEKFSTALYARPLKDPFAQAAVKDAERTAENVSLHKRFPLEFPRQGLGTLAIGALVLLTMAFLPRMDLFGREAQRQAKAVELAKTNDAKRELEKALQVIVEAQAKGVADEETIQQAKKDLQMMLNAPIHDAEKAKRSAARALSDVDQSIKQQIANNQRFADAENDSKAFKSLMPSPDDKGPVADAERKIAKGQFEDALDDISKAVENFDKMTEQDQKKAAQQMQQMAQQLQQMANDPKQQQQMQQQMQNMGLNQQQAQQAQQLMQQAAQGDKQAQQQLQQMAKQAMQQMNNGQGPNQQQKQQIQQMMQQMQAQANAQQQAQQMAQAAQQMAQAMQQQAGQQQGQQGQQAAQQQAAQQMAQGKGAMQQQLQAMQAMKADAQQVAAAQQAAAAAAQQAANALNGQNGNAGQQANGQQGQWQGNNGQWNNNNNRQFKGPNKGMAGGGIGAGDRSQKEQAPYQVKEEISHSDDIDTGKILASTLIKAKTVRGDSKVGASEVAPPPQQEQTDEVEQERIGRPAQEAVKNYFSAWQKDAGSVPTPEVTPTPQQ